jgi:hypothetical protein
LSRSCSGLPWRVILLSTEMSKSHRSPAYDFFKVRDNLDSGHVAYALAETSHLLANARVYFPIHRNQEGIQYQPTSKKSTHVLRSLLSELSLSLSWIWMMTTR